MSGVDQFMTFVVFIAADMFFGMDKNCLSPA